MNRYYLWHLINEEEFIPPAKILAILGIEAPAVVISIDGIIPDGTQALRAALKAEVERLQVAKIDRIAQNANWMRTTLENEQLRADLAAMTTYADKLNDALRSAIDEALAIIAGGNPDLPAEVLAEVELILQEVQCN